MGERPGWKLNASDAPAYETIDAAVPPNGVPLSKASSPDEEKQGVGTVYHTSSSGMVLDTGTSPDGYYFPTMWRSMWEWAAEDAQKDDDRWGWRDMVASGATEFIGCFIFYMVLHTVIALTRTGLTSPYTTADFVGVFPIAVILTAALGYMFVHATMWTHSVHLNPAISFVEVFSPSSWRRYQGKTITPGGRWAQAWVMMFVQWVAQLGGTVLGVWVAWELENTFSGQLPSELRAAYPLYIGVTATQAGVLIGLGYYVFSIAYFSMTMENYRNSSAQTRSLYTGLAMGFAYLFTFVQTTATFSVFQVLASSFVNAQYHPWNTLTATCNPAAPPDTDATCFSNGSFWAIVTFPSFIAAILGYLTWFTILRLTSMNATYTPLRSKAKFT